MKNIKIGIYCIKNRLNNRCYIGQSNDIYKRWNQHKAALKEGNGNRKLQIDWDKYGENSFDFLILEELPDDKYELEKRESYYAYTYDAWNEGYNISKLLDFRNFSDADIIHHKEHY
ncbi:GIY-YIG nuclease family protein [Ancylomarina sp. DW003]|nr:GIY-YIG nuclease family protein [Ancylomarina sp. DW003]MDE5422124.1 GIY-YIG nuclease family protein [Ancylomarina sp. DW003]